MPKASLFLGFFIIFAGIVTTSPAQSSQYEVVPGCPGVYKFYGANLPDAGVGSLYYISSGKNASLACFKGSRTGGATPLKSYIKGPYVIDVDKRLLIQAGKDLGLENVYVHNVGI